MSASDQIRAPIDESVPFTGKGLINEILSLPLSVCLAFLLAVLGYLTLVDGVISQLELYFLGSLPVPEYLIKGMLVAFIVPACIAYPRDRATNSLRWPSLLCIVYLLADIAHLSYTHRMSLAVIFQGYSGYYALLLVGSTLLSFRGKISQPLVVRTTVCAMLVCTVIGAMQYLRAEPILYTDSPGAAFRVDSWAFFDQVRAFSLFTSAMNFGMFCALGGALGVALSRQMPVRGTLLVLLSAFGSFTTLTRVSYLIFFCSSTYAVVLTFGKKAKRGRWQPFIYLAMGIATIAAGVRSLVTEGTGNLQDAATLLQRIGQWTFYTDMIVRAPLVDQLFGFGIVQNEKILPLYPMIIDNTPLALVIHIGIVGFVLFGILLLRMWLQLRRDALAGREPFTVAAASLWASLACGGMFNIVFSGFSAVFILAILCGERETQPSLPRSNAFGSARAPV